MGVPVYRTASTVQQYTDISVYRYTPINFINSHIYFHTSDDIKIDLLPSAKILHLYPLHISLPRRYSRNSRCFRYCMKPRVGPQDNMSMCILKGILDTLSRDKTLNAKLAVCFIQLYCPIFIMVHKIFWGNWPMLCFSSV